MSFALARLLAVLYSLINRPHHVGGLEHMAHSCSSTSRGWNLVNLELGVRPHVVYNIQFHPKASNLGLREPTEPAF